MTVNNQIVVGTLMNLSDNPTRVSIGQDWRESDVTKRIPVIVTGNDFSTIYAPLIRDGRMEKFYWYMIFASQGAALPLVTLTYLHAGGDCFISGHISDYISFMNRQPTHEDIVNIVQRMYEKDGISGKEVVHVVDTFPNQGNNLRAY